MTHRFVTWHSLKNKFGNASWCIDGGMVKVVTPHGHKAAQIGGMPPEFLARILMRELHYLHGPDAA